MPRSDITPVTNAATDLSRSAPKLNQALDEIESNRNALVAATNKYNDSIVAAAGMIEQVTTDVTAVRDAADGLLGQAITLPSQVELPPELPPELVRSPRGVKLTK